MLVVPYLRSAFTSNSPALLLVRAGGTPLFGTYQNEFDLILSHSKEWTEPSAAS
jgi:hypothetical protein